MSCEILYFFSLILIKSLKIIFSKLMSNINNLSFLIQDIKF